MQYLTRRTLTLAGCVAAGMWLAGSADAQQKQILIGSQCDRTGPTQLVGTVFCPGVQDYVNLINSQGGVDGYKVVINELDNNYQVPPAIEEYERHKQEGAVSILIWGTPQAEALNPRLEKDHIPGTSPGFGSAAAANGAKYPYLFPLAATYWSQGAAAIKFVKDKLGGSLKGKKIAYLYYDNPAGLEPMPILKELQQNEGFELRTFAVPPPGVEMSAQILDIAQRYRPDFVLAHLFGRSPSVMIKGLKQSGYPLSKVLGFVWASSEADIAGGGWLAGGAGLPHHAVRRRRRRLPGDPGNQGDVPEGGQGAAEGDGDVGLLQPRHPGCGCAYRGAAQCTEADRWQATDRRGHEEGLRDDQGLHAWWPAAAAAGHAVRS